MRAKEIARALAGQAEAVCRHLLPAGQRQGHEWQAGDVAGTPGRSLKVHLDGDRAGVWADFAAGAKEQSGDLLDLWREARGLTLSEALAEAHDWLGVEKPAVQAAREQTYRRPAKPKTAKPITEKKGAVEAYLRTQRGLTLETQKVFRVVEAAEKEFADPGKKPWRGPWVCFPYLRPVRGALELDNIKWFHLEKDKNGKKIMLQEQDARPSLFGWQTIADDAREVTICEGEIDAMSLYQIGRPALSVPQGGGIGHKHDWIGSEWDNLERFDLIYLCMEQDKDGVAAQRDIAARLGLERCRLVALPEGKDANDHLVAGAMAGQWADWFAAAVELTPELLRPAEHYREATLAEFYPTDEEQLGIPSGFPSLKERFAWRYGEVSVLTGINGHGKSLVLAQMTNYAMDFGARACVASLEMRPQKLLERQIRQVTQQLKPDKTQIGETFDWFAGRLWFYARSGVADRGGMLNDFKYARRRWDCRLFVIDSLMRCGLRTDDYDGQERWVDTLVNFAQDEGVHIVLVAHPRKQQDENERVGKLDVKGAGGITDLAYNCLSIMRNKRKETKLADLGEKDHTDPDVYAKKQKQEQEPDGWLGIDKQRHGTSWEGRIRLWFDPDSQSFRDRRDGTAPRCQSLVASQPVPASAFADDDVMF